MRIVRWIATAVLIIGGVLLANAAFLVVRQAALVMAGTAATGEVIALQPVSATRGPTLYRPVVRFMTENGPTTIVGQVNANPPAYAVGDAVRVLYNRERPSEATIDSFAERWFHALIFGVLGAAAATLGGVVRWRVGHVEDLRRRGRRVRARVVEVRQERGRRVRARARVLEGGQEGGWRVVCEWENPLTRETHRFESALLDVDPGPHVVQGHVDVLVDTSNPARYWVDTDFPGRAA